MPALDPITNASPLPTSLGTSRPSLALESAEKIRHTDSVPGATDNDADSWRKLLQAQAAHDQSEIADLRDLIQDIVKVPGRAWQRATAMQGQFIGGTSGILDVNEAELQWLNAADANKVTQFVVAAGASAAFLIRIPIDESIAAYSMQITSGPSIYVGSFGLLGDAADDAHKYYLARYGNNTSQPATVTLSVHTTAYQWVGELLADKVFEILGLARYSSENRGWGYVRNKGDNAGMYLAPLPFLSRAKTDDAAAITLTLADRSFLVIASRAGDQTVAIPDAVSEGACYGVIKGADGGAVTIRNGTTTLATLTDQHDVAVFLDDGSTLREVVSVGRRQAQHASLFEVIPDDTDRDEALPDNPTPTPDPLKIRFWRGDFYHWSPGHGPFAASFRAAKRVASSVTTIGFQINDPVNFDNYGQGIFNPNGLFGAVEASIAEFIVQIRLDAVTAALGRAPQSGVAFKFTLTSDEDTPRTLVVDAVPYTGTFTGRDGVSYAGFDKNAPRTNAVIGGNFWDDDLVGHTVTVDVESGGSPILRGTAAHWVPVTLEQVAELARNVAEDIDGLETAIGSDKPRIAALEEKAAAITFDDDPEWASNPNTAVGGKHPYGGWIWIRNTGSNEHDGFNVENYKGRSYNDAVHAGGAGFDGSGSGLLWVLPNNINWSRVRLVVRRANGTIRTVINAQTSLRNVPAAITVANLPASPPDVTVRWSASSDTDPFAISNIDATDTIALEVLPAAHVPVWGGEISDQLRRRVAANEAFVASINQQLRNDLATAAYRAVEEIDDDTDWDSSTNTFGAYPFEWSQGGMQDGDFVEVTWRNMRHPSDLSRTFAAHGSSEQSGRFLFHYHDLHALSARRPVNSLSDENLGFIGDSSGDIRLGSPLADDPESAKLRCYLYRIGATLYFDTTFSVVGSGGSSNTPNQGKMPEGFYLLIRTWRADTVVHSTRLLPDRPTPASARPGLVPKFDREGAQAYLPPIAKGVQLGHFGNPSGGGLGGYSWTVDGPNAFGTGSVSASGQTLRMVGLGAANRAGFGVVVEVVRGGNVQSRVFIPWSAFRTTSGSWVTGGTRSIAQGHFAGFWRADQANSMIFADCHIDTGAGRFDLTLSGASADTSSTLTVYEAI